MHLNKIKWMFYIDNKNAEKKDSMDNYKNSLVFHEHQPEKDIHTANNKFSVSKYSIHLVVACRWGKAIFEYQ